MGYYGLGPGMNSRQADKLTEFEQALRKLPLDKAAKILEELERIVRNIVRSPAEEAFRQVDVAENDLLNILETQALMVELGFQREGDIMILPNTVRLDFQKHVGGIIDVKDFYKKEQEKAKKRARLAQLAQDPAKTESLRQAELDRREQQASQNATKLMTQSAAMASAPVDVVQDNSIVTSAASVAVAKVEIRAETATSAAVTEQVAVVNVPAEERPAVQQCNDATQQDAVVPERKESTKEIEELRLLREQRYQSSRPGRSAPPRGQATTRPRGMRCLGR